MKNEIIEKTINILITGSGTVTCQSIIKGLKIQNQLMVNIVTVDMDSNNAGRYFSDKFYKIPPANDKNFISSLLKICKKERIDILIPIIDYEFEKLSQSIKEFNDIGCKIVISNSNTIKKIKFLM